jgi:hypothetical protein
MEKEKKHFIEYTELLFAKQEEFDKQKKEKR